MIDVDTSNPKLAVEHQQLAYRTLGVGRITNVGRPRKRYEAVRSAELPLRVPVYAYRGGNRKHIRWGSIAEAAAALGVPDSTLGTYLDHPRARVRGLRLSRYAPPPSEAEVWAEQDRLAATFVRVPHGGSIGPAILAAREAVAKRKEQQR